MKKKSISAILAASTLACVATAVPASAAEATSGEFVITTDAAKVHPGDVVTCTLSVKANGSLNSLEVYLQFPEGLKYVPLSVEAVEGADEILGWIPAERGDLDYVGVTDPSKTYDPENIPVQVLGMGTVGKDISGQTVDIATFKVEVTADYAGGEITLIKEGQYEGYVTSDINFTSITPTVTGASLTKYAIKKVDATDSTCTKKGVIEHYACECGKELYSDAEGTKPITAASVEKALLPHTPAEAAEEKFLKSEATCVAPAEYYKSCSECGTKLDETFTSGDVDPENHTGNTRVENELDATVDEEGYSGDVYCDDCGEMIEEGHVTDKLPETPDEGDGDGTGNGSGTGNGNGNGGTGTGTGNGNGVPVGGPSSGSGSTGGSGSGSTGGSGSGSSGGSTTTPSTSTPSTSTPSTSTPSTSTPGTTTPGTTNPATGISLAIAPVVLAAGAAAVIFKNKKK